MMSSAIISWRCGLAWPAFVAFVVLVTAPAAGAEDPHPPDRLKLEVSVAPADPFSEANKAGSSAKPKFRRGEAVTLTITGIPGAGYYTYPVTQRTEKQGRSGLSVIAYDDNPNLEALPPVQESEPTPKEVEGEGTFLVYADRFVWTQDVLILENAKPGPTTLSTKIRTQVCNKSGCVWGVNPYDIPIDISSEPAVPYTPELKARLEAALTSKPKNPQLSPPDRTPGTLAGKNEGKGLIDAATPEEYKEGLTAILARLIPLRTEDLSLLEFILMGMFWGGVSLVTPCVFPMIPITVSFFLKQSEKQHHRPVFLALVYCATIIIVLTIAAVLLLSFFRALSFHPLMNIGIGCLFVFFALSLFGMYEIELPSGLAQFTSAREGQGGVAGTVFMALTFTILSFACVAPFLGGFGGTAATAKVGWLGTILGGLAFSVTFAAPFFVLALFPNLLKKMPKSGTWLNSVKVVMGFLELAAAFKFFRGGELVIHTPANLMTFDLVLGIWIALSILCGLYLLGVFRLPHDTPLEHLSVPRLLFSMAFLGLAFYLLPALFTSGDGEKQRPRGAIYAWVDSFLLPEFRAGKGGLEWTDNLQYALDEALARRRATGEPQYVFIDHTGVS